MRISESRHITALAVWVCIALQAALTLSYAISLHYELKTSGFDSMVYEQLMRNFLDGKDFTCSINPPYIPQPWMGFHFSPILYLLIPFYYFFPHMEMFLVFGSAAMALAAWPIFLAAREILKNETHALLMALLYLCSPFVVNGTIWGFHEIDFAPLIIAWMLWAVVKYKRITLLALSVVLVCIKEHYGLSIAGFGLLWAWQWKEKRFGVSLCAAGLITMYVVIGIIIPHFNPLGTPTMIAANGGEDRFSWVTTTQGIRSHIAFILSDGLWYGMKLLLPFLLLPLGAFMWLLPAIADAGINTLSAVSMMRYPFSYHSAALVPILIIASCHTLKRYVRPYKMNDAMLPLLVASAGFAYVQLALPFSEMGNVWELSSPRFDYTAENRKAIDEINHLIPKEAAVAAQINVLPHLLPRLEMYPYPSPNGNAQYVVVHFRFPFEHALGIMGIPYGSTSGNYFAAMDTLIADPKWGVVYEASRWVVLRKDVPSDSAALARAQKGLEDVKNEFHTVREHFGKPTTTMNP